MTVHFSWISCGVHQLHSLYHCNDAIKKDDKAVWQAAIDKHLRDVWSGSFQFYRISDDVVTAVDDDGTTRKTNGLYMATRKAGRQIPYIVFSDNYQAGNGRGLAKYIEENKLGPIITTNGDVNPNSYNMIDVWVWNVDYEALDKYAKEKGWTNE